MKQHIMKYLSLNTEKYFMAFLANDNHGAAWALAAINSAYGYTEDEEVARFTIRLHSALIELSIERSKQLGPWKHPVHC